MKSFEGDVCAATHT